MSSPWHRAVTATVGLAAIVVGPLVASDWPLASTVRAPTVPADAAAVVEPIEPAAPQPDAAATPGTPAAEPDDLAQSTAPLRTADAADPFVAIDDEPWLFTTNNATGNVPVVTRRSEDTADGVVVGDALPVLPDWAEPGFTWAPAVTRTNAGWVLAFTARHAASGRQCIGVATSSAVVGPYSPATEPLVCDLDRGGSIDPSFVTDDAGARWLLYKDDGNCCGLPTTLRAVPLTPDATALAGSAVDLLSADLPWEAGLVEAPSMSKVGDRWLLLYSANRWDSADYAVGAAWCDSPAGPCEKQSTPALTAGGGLDGPGGVEFVSRSRPNRPLVTFHAWPPGQIGYGDGSTRRLQLGRVEVAGDAVSIGPITTAER
jgi:arabinan endo-1,5-alpha-L-arabinosidase